MKQIMLCDYHKIDTLFILLIIGILLISYTFQCNYSTDIKWDYSYPHIQFNSPVKDFWYFIQITNISSLCNHDFKEQIYYNYMSDMMNATKNRLLIIATGVFKHCY